MMLPGTSVAAAIGINHRRQEHLACKLHVHVHVGYWSHVPLLSTPLAVQHLKL